MSKSFTLQSSFNNGVLDPLMHARLDLKQYYQGVEVGTNVDCLPQGGMRRRPGLEYIGTIDGPGRIIPFVFNTEQKYILVMTDLQIQVYRDDALVDTVVTPYLEADLFDIDFAQSGDTMILVHEDYAVRTLQRGATDADFTIATLNFGFVPQYDFNDASSPTPTSEIQTLTFANFSEGDTFKVNLEGIDTDEITFNTDISSTAADIETALAGLSNTPASGISASGSGSVVTVTFAGSSARPWRKMSGRVITTIDNSSGNSITAARTQTGVARTEDTWSATRGYPRSVTFHEGRLWFGGSSSRPNTIWGSRVSDFFNFDPGKSLADQAINVSLDTDQVNRIQSILSGRTLQIFTIGGEFAPRQQLNDPITPENIAIARQTQIGSKKIKPIIIEGGAMFVQRTGRAIYEMVFDVTQDAYASGTLSLLSAHLINDPIQMAARRGTTSEDANRVYFVNSDGGVSVFNTLRDQAVAAWTTWTTSGLFKSVAVALEDLYFLVSREINGATVYYLEKGNPGAFTDSAQIYSGLGSDTLADLDHLEGETVRIKGDGAVLQSATVASGEVTAQRAITDGEAGLDFFPTITTLPAVQDVGAGFNLDDEKRITNCTLDVLQSLGIYVNGIFLPDRRFGTGNLDTSPAPYTGRKSTRLLGWSKVNQITITQRDPLPMTIRGISLEVDG